MIKKKPTIKDIAKIAQVSPATVSRVLNYDTTLNVSLDTKKRIFEAAEELSYVAAKNSKIYNRKKIGFFFAYTAEEELEDVYYLALRVDIARIFGIENKEIIRIDQNTNNTVLKSLDGIVTLGLADDEDIQWLRKLSIPTLCIDSDLAPGEFSTIVFDLRLGVKSALEYLLASGHTKIGFIGGTDESRNELILKDDRIVLFEDYMSSRNLLNNRWIAVGRYTPEDGYHLFKKVFADKDERPSAVFISNDSMAVGCYKAAFELGLKIPEDVSIVGFNNLASSQYLQPPLTTVDLDVEYLVVIANRVMDDMIDKKLRLPLKIVIPTQLLERDSVFSLGEMSLSNLNME